MARIGTYGNDQDIQAEDRWIGTTSLDGSTINFTAQELGYFYSISGLADSGRLTFAYTYVGQYVDGSSDLSVGGNLFYGGSSVPTPANLTEIYISRFTTHNIDIQPITQVLLDDVIKLTSLDSPQDTKYALYDVNAVENETDANGNTIGYKLTVAIKIRGLVDASSGDLGRSVVNITPLGDSSTSTANANPVVDLSFFRDDTVSPVDFKLRATLLDGTTVDSNALNELGFGRLLNGTANPNNLVQGYPGDFFLDYNNQMIYGPLASEGFNWGAGTSIIGMDGTDGTDGEAGLSGAQGPQGIQGVQGEQGIQGVQGETGNTGADGAQGAQGLFDIEIYRIDTTTPTTPVGGTYTISTNTLVPPAGWVTSPSAPAAGEQLYESRAQINPISGDVQTPDWSAPFQAGAQGATGNQGVGISTATVVGGMLTLVLTNGTTLGPFNVAGPQGEKGEQGDQGIQGIQGVQGNQGDKGDQGDAGAQGLDGLPVSTATGVINAAGNTEVTFGTSATPNIGEVLVQRGEVGPQGSEGPSGTFDVEKDSIPFLSDASALNFVGDNITLANSSGTVGTTARFSFTVNAFETTSPRYNILGSKLMGQGDANFFEIVANGDPQPTQLSLLVGTNGSFVENLVNGVPTLQIQSRFIAGQNQLQLLADQINNMPIDADTQLVGSGIGGITTAAIVRRRCTASVATTSTSATLTLIALTPYVTDLADAGTSTGVNSFSIINGVSNVSSRIDVSVVAASTSINVSHAGTSNTDVETIDFEGTAIDSVVYSESSKTATVNINDNAYTFTDTPNTGKTALGVDFTTTPNGTHDFTVTGAVDSSALIVTPNPSGVVDAGNLTKITIDGSIWGIPSGGINSIFTVLNATGQSVPNGTIAIVNSTMQYYNVSGVIQTDVTTATDFTDAAWLQVGDAGTAAINSVLGTPNEVDVSTTAGVATVSLNSLVTADIAANTAVRISNVNTATSTTDLTSLTIGATSYRIRNGHDITVNTVTEGSISRLSNITIDGTSTAVSAVFGNVAGAIVNNGNLNTLTINNEVYSLPVPADGSIVTVGTRTVGTATAVDSITVDGATSNISDVFVNPVGTPTNSITSLQIDGTHYSIAGTGGGSTVSIQTHTASGGTDTAVSAINIDGTVTNVSDVFPNVGINNQDVDLFSLEIDGLKYQIVTVVPTIDTAHGLLDSLEINGITNDVTVVVADTSLIGAHTPLRTMHINGADFTLLRPNDGATTTVLPLLNVVDGETTYTLPILNGDATSTSVTLNRIVLDGITYNVDGGTGTTQNLFQTIGGITANTPTDVLNVIGGDNITVVADTGTDTLTFNAADPGTVVVANAINPTQNLSTISIAGVVYQISGGTPPSSSAPSGLLENSSGFNTDRFDLQTDDYSILGSWTLNGATIDSATLTNGTATETLTVGSTDTSFEYDVVAASPASFRSGNQSITYTLNYTESDGTTTGSVTSNALVLTLDKSLPGNPSLSATGTGFLLGVANNQIEQADAGTLNATGAAGALNGWEVTTAYAITPSASIAVAATDTASVSFNASVIYQSPAGANSTTRIHNATATTVSFTKIRSIRWGQSISPTIDQAFIDDFATNWNGGASSTTMQIDKGTVDPNGFDFDIVINVGGNVMYLVYDAARADLRSILISGINTLSGWTITTVGNYKVYLLNSPQAPNSTYDITLTT